MGVPGITNAMQYSGYAFGSLLGIFDKNRMSKFVSCYGEWATSNRIVCSPLYISKTYNRRLMLECYSEYVEVLEQAWLCMPLYAIVWCTCVRSWWMGWQPVKIYTV